MAILLESLGFTINVAKSQLSPSQQIKFLGFQVDSKRMKLRGKSTEHNPYLPGGLDPGQDVNTAAITVAGQVECSISGHTISFSPLLSVAAVEDPVTQKVEVISTHW